jgi:hypothetical protein
MLKNKPRGRPIAERIAEKAKPVESGCHEWQGCLLPNGYGQVHLKGKTVLAHRAAYEVANGPIPDGLFVLHSCDNRKCVNPDHLSVGTRDDNAADMVSKLRQAHGTKNGHAKLTSEQVRDIRAAIGSCKEIGARYSVTYSTVSMIRSGRIWKHV